MAKVSLGTRSVPRCEVCRAAPASQHAGAGFPFSFASRSSSRGPQSRLYGGADTRPSLAAVPTAGVTTTTPTPW